MDFTQQVRDKLFEPHLITILQGGDLVTAMMLSWDMTPWILGVSAISDNRQVSVEG